MDEKQLKDMLSAVKAPAPSNDAKENAVLAAFAAFDKNIVEGAQGRDDGARHTDIGSTNHVRRFLMQKRYVLSGMGGAVALTALVAVLGTPYFHQEMKNISAVSGSADVQQAVGREVNDPEYVKKVQQQNEKGAKEASAAGKAYVPTPIAPAENQTLTLPATPTAPAADTLAGWRAKTEAKRVEMEREQAPADDGKLTQKKPESDKDVADALAPMKEAEVAKRAPASVPAQPQAQTALTFKSMSENIVTGGAAGAAAVNAPAESRRAAVGQLKADSAASIAIPMPQPAPVVSPSPSDYNAQPYYQDQGRDEFPNYDDNGVKEVSAEPVSTFSIDVDTSSYSFIRRLINGGQLPPKGAVRLEELINYFPYNYALPAKNEDPFKPTVAVYQCPWSADHKLMHIGIKGYDLENKPKSNLVFLIDTSGSMNSPDKLPLLISSFKLMLDNLNPEDTVGIVTYAGSAGVALEPTKAGEKSKIIAALDHLQAGGSTAGAEGIRTAYELAEKGLIKEGNNRILLATDGDFNVGISNQDELKSFIEKKRNEGIFLSTMGFGMGNYHDNTMQTLAQNGNGNASYIDNLNEARKVLVEEAGSTLFTIAKDVKIQVEFNPNLVQEYRLIGYETRHLNREDFNNDKIDAGEIGSGHAVTAIYEITPVGATPVVDDLRYAAKEKALASRVDAEDKSKFADELAFLKIRYKRPDQNTSVLMTRPVTQADEQKFDALPDDIRFAAAVAGFGQLLRENKYTGSLSWDDVIKMANDARGKDEFGYRTEFVNLVRLAKSEAHNGQPTTK